MRIRSLGYGAALLLSLLASAAPAQTLDEQYDLYLLNGCRALGFERDGDEEILPGQAGPSLFAACTGRFALPSGGPIISLVGSGSGVAAGSGRQAVEEGALRQRREERRKESETSTIDEGIATNLSSLFSSLDLKKEEQAPTRYEGGRSSTRLTGTLGLDRRFGRALIAGAALRGETLGGEFAAGGQFKSDGYGGSAYASWFPLQNFFVDLSAGFDSRSQRTRRVMVRKVVTISQFPPQTITIRFDSPRAIDGSTDSQEESADLLSGYDFSFGFLSVGPRLGAAWRHSTIDAYIENSNSPLALAFDKRTETSLRSALGLQASVALPWSAGVAVSQLNVFWHHEFRDDQQLLSARLAEDLRPNPTSLRYLNEAPDRETYSARLSLAAVFQEGLNAFCSVEKTFKHRYQDQVVFALGVRWEL